MSSLTSLLPPSTQQTSNLLVPTTQPIPLLTDPLAKAYGYAYTAGVLIFYYLRSGALVRDPLTTLVADIVPIAVFQSLFCAICLPVSGAWNNSKTDEGNAATSKRSGNTSGTALTKRRIGAPGSSTKGAGSGRPTRETVFGGHWQGRIMPTVLSLILTITVPPVPLAVLALVLGAPLYPTTILPHTFALAMHVSLLSFLPIFYTHGVSSTAWRDVVAAWLPFDDAGVWGGAVGSLVGGWVGAIPIALDWDRDWQAWPCTVVWGAVLGWAIGRMLTAGLKLGIGSRINLSVPSKAPEHATISADVNMDDSRKQQ